LSGFLQQSITFVNPNELRHYLSWKKSQVQWNKSSKVKFPGGCWQDQQLKPVITVLKSWDTFLPSFLLCRMKLFIVNTTILMVLLESYFINPLTAKWGLRAHVDFTLSNSRRFYSSMGNPSAGKGLIYMLWFKFILGLMCFKLVSILFAIVPDYGNKYMTKGNNRTSFKNFAPKLNLNHNI